MGMEPMEQIRRWFLHRQVEQIGAVDYTAVLPLLPVGSRRRIPAESQSVLLALFPYYIGELPKRNIARYTVSPDYHSVCGKILAEVVVLCQETWPKEEFAWFVDASPIREVEAARAAGLGVVGWNGQLITPPYGSYQFIGEIVTTLALPAGEPLPGGCLECGRCIAACPTGALGRGKVDCTLCRSHITQKKGELTQEEAASVSAGGMVWGCDICTDVCPHNAHPVLTPIRGFYETLCPIITWDNLTGALENRALNYRGEKVLRRNLALIEEKDQKTPSEPL